MFKPLTLLRDPEGSLVLFLAAHRKYADVIVRTAAEARLRHVLVAELARYVEVPYDAPPDLLVQRFLADALPGVTRHTAPKVFEALALHGL